MTAGEIAAHLLETCGTLSDVKAYMFGSCLHGVGRDIDILIVVSTDEKLSKLKKELDAAGQELPLDILYMDPSEARETDFVVGQKCLELSRLTLTPHKK